MRVGSILTGKMVIYPIVDDVDGEGNQLINWMAEIKRDTREQNDWNKPGDLADFFPIYQNWRFDWLDVAQMIKDADQILEYPMVDKDPVERWTFGRVTLAGDAAHPMYPRGSNGAAQAAIDARTLADLLAQERDPRDALKAYEAARLRADRQGGAHQPRAPAGLHQYQGRGTGRRPAVRRSRQIHHPGRIAGAVGELQAHRRLCARPTWRPAAAEPADRSTFGNLRYPTAPCRAWIAALFSRRHRIRHFGAFITLSGATDWMGVSDGDRPAADDSDEALMARIARGDERAYPRARPPPSAGHARARPPHSRQRRRRRGRGAGGHAAGVDACAALAAAGGVPHLAHARGGQSLSRPQTARALGGAGSGRRDRRPGARRRRAGESERTRAAGSPPPSPNCRRASAPPSCSPMAMA